MPTYECVRHYRVFRTSPRGHQAQEFVHSQRSHHLSLYVGSEQNRGLPRGRGRTELVEGPSDRGRRGPREGRGQDAAGCGPHNVPLPAPAPESPGHASYLSLVCLFSITTSKKILIGAVSITTKRSPVAVCGSVCTLRLQQWL